MIRLLDGKRLSTEDVDKRTGELQDEFYKFHGQCKEEAPYVPSNVIFESWVMQKIAGIQLCVEQLTNDNITIRNLISLKMIKR